LLVPDSAEATGATIPDRLKTTRLEATIPLFATLLQLMAPPS
jgi:hypothetical protein